MIKLIYILGWILAILGCVCVISAFVIQIAVSLELYGVAFHSIIIKHWSLWLYLGIIPMFIGYFIMLGGEK